jgi:nucleoside phosphorylase
MNSDSHLLFCFAVAEEAGPFRKRVQHRTDVAVLITGMGPQNAEMTVRNYLSRHTPQQVFTCGFAGGLDPCLRVGDVIYESLPMPRALPAAASGNSPNDILRVRQGRFLCMSRVITTATEKRDQFLKSGADAVEMESGAINPVCREKGIPCATVRAISDISDDDLPLDFNELMDANQRLSYARLAWSLVRSPVAIPKLLHLQRNCRFAAERLAQVLIEIANLYSPKTN